MLFQYLHFFTELLQFVQPYLWYDEIKNGMTIEFEACLFQRVLQRSHRFSGLDCI